MLAILMYNLAFLVGVAIGVIVIAMVPVNGGRDDRDR